MCSCLDLLLKEHKSKSFEALQLPIFLVLAVLADVDYSLEPTPLGHAHHFEVFPKGVPHNTLAYKNLLYLILNAFPHWCLLDVSVSNSRNVSAIVNNLRARTNVALKEFLKMFVYNRNSRQLLPVFAFHELTVKRNILSIGDLVSCRMLPWGNRWCRLLRLQQELFPIPRYSLLGMLWGGFAG